MGREVIEKAIKKRDIDLRFNDPELLNHIYEELNKDHKLDDKEKISLFLIRTTAELKDPNDRKSAALKGDSSAGKDNAIKTVLKHFPEEDNFFLTRGTQAALEEEASKVKCIAFSEINAHREKGANTEITEVFKQLAEGGTNTLKKDAATGYKTTINHKSEQKTLLYGTTETATDDELETRYVIIPIKGYPAKNKIVVDDSLTKAGTESYYLEKANKQESWIAKSIRNLDHDVQVIIPFTEALKEPIKDEDGKEKYFFDYTKERIKRDAKRLLSLTKAITWLHQNQRIIKEISGIKFLYAEPTDFITAVILLAEFFNLTYTGLDHRLQKTHEKIKELEGKHDAEIIKYGFENKYVGWVVRNLLADELGINSVNTIKEHIGVLKDHQLVEGYYETSKPYLIRGVNRGVNRVSLPISLTALDTLLTPYLTGKNWYDNNPRKPIKLSFLNFLDDKEEKQAKKRSVSNTKIDTVKIDTVNLQDIHTQIKASILAFDRGFGCKTQEITLFVQSNGFVENSKIETAINNLKRDGEIFEVKPDLWKLI